MKHKSSYFHPFVIDQKKKKEKLWFPAFVMRIFSSPENNLLFLCVLFSLSALHDLKKWKGEKNPSALPHIDSMSL